MLITFCSFQGHAAASQLHGSCWWTRSLRFIFVRVSHLGVISQSDTCNLVCHCLLEAWLTLLPTGKPLLSCGLSSCFATTHPRASDCAPSLRGLTSSRTESRRRIGREREGATEPPETLVQWMQRRDVGADARLCRPPLLPWPRINIARPHGSIGVDKHWKMGQRGPVVCSMCRACGLCAAKGLCLEGDSRVLEKRPRRP